MKRVRAMLGLSVAVALVTVACSDSSRSLTAPTMRGPAASQNLLGLGGLLGTVTDLLLPPVKRTTPLASDVSWTFTAGPGGATSSNSDVGLTVVVPYGALATTQQITVTALAGAPVAYRFEPHLVFSKKVYLTQSLRGTNVGLVSSLLNSLLLSGGHFAGDQLEVNASGLAILNEAVPATTNLWTRTSTFGVEHFTGWILASGRADDGGY
jgi:hypothetical protein